MADSNDFDQERITRSLIKQYMVLRSACEMMPLPIVLPKQADGIFDNSEASPAVRRIVEIADELPIPEENRAELFTAALFWLTASDLLAIILGHGWSDVRGFQALAALELSGDALAAFGMWVLDQK
ncbi:hypothetical protein ABTZ78_17305 [Streptomyces bauhiniae]|uniref:hypothetical protein n=1 Tax=Streptomyces bauhiniae TaxID=2340725 RepID=UPI00332D62D5